MGFRQLFSLFELLWTSAIGILTVGVNACLRRHRFAIIPVVCGLYVVVCTLLRLGLILRSWGDVDGGLGVLFVLQAGLFFDLCSATWIALPIALYLFVLPQKWFAARWHRCLARTGIFLFIFFVVFNAVAEWVFWGEFSVRYNFIAVDYLVYTTEVVKNIHESYPMPLILSTLLLVTAVIYVALSKMGYFDAWLSSETPLRKRWRPTLAFAVLPALVFFGVSRAALDGFGNNFNRELAKNGPYSFFGAFWHNEIDFDQFYPTVDEGEALAEVRRRILEPGSEYVYEGSDLIDRNFASLEPELKPNVVLICVESLSGRFLNAWGKEPNLMPNLDRLVGEGLFFRRLYATGTRTVRGMEAIMLSVPPTPGRSILKREGIDDLYTLGTPFQDRGYDTAFLYGGHGYFDNMNAFFSSNGFRIVDRASASGADVTFETAWGACDEDLFNWSLREADAMEAAGKPFFQFVMTTSNHRPYTYPDGKVSIPSKTSREGAVQYTDFAIGQFIEQAKLKPWFDNTIFIIVADHCASSAGKDSIPLKYYEIPCLFYAPKLIPAANNETLCSQIDVGPTLLAQLGWSYQSEFFGRSILATEKADARAFIGTYQKLGYFDHDGLTILLPGKKVEQYRCSPRKRDQVPVEPEADRTATAISYYQIASLLYRSGRMRKDEEQ